MSYLDADGDGYITRRDFRIMAGDMGMGWAGQMYAQRAFNRMDRNHDGFISPYELHRAHGGWGGGGFGYGGYGGGYGGYGGYGGWW